MEFFQVQNINHWQLWTPLIGGIIIYVGLNIRIISVDEDE